MNVICVFQKQINMIPSLFVVDSEITEEALPTLIYFHGFTSAKEHNLPFAYLLAKEGYRVILPDSKLHGERETNISATEKQLSFWDIVLKNVTELKEIKQFLDQEGLLLNNRIGVAGTS